MTYEESVKYLYKIAGFAKKSSLEDINYLLEQLGNPHKDLKFVHVAGTNGKGSVCAFLEAVLKEHGKTTAAFTSPHLVKVNERIRLNGQDISDERFKDVCSRVKECVEAAVEKGVNQPSFFEMMFLMALCIMEEEQPDICLIETGMGGRYDATNVIIPEVSVITSISMDHMSFLGNTLAQIAEKKAGIIKDGCRVVTARQKPEAMQVIERISREHGAKCTIADASEAEMLKESCLGQTIRYRGEEYEIPLAGVYQKENAVVALNALKVLDELGFPTAAEQKKEGLRTVNWNGRFTVICKKPLFVVDGAHNPAAADMMAASIEHYFKGKRIIYIMGVFADKDYRSVIQKTAHFADRILTIQTPNNIRALPAGELAKTVSEYNPNVQAMDTIKDAVEEAFSLAGEQDVIIAFGSLSFIGEMTDIVENL